MSIDKTNQITSKNPINNLDPGLSNPNMSEKANPALQTKFAELSTYQSRLRENQGRLDAEKNNQDKSSEARKLELKSIIEFLKEKVKDLVTYIGQNNPNNTNSSFKAVPDKNDFQILS